jgi:hypothetical protein
LQKFAKKKNIGDDEKQWPFIQPITSENVIIEDKRGF